MAERIVEKLEQLVEVERLPAGPHGALVLHAGHGSVSVEAHVLGFDRVGCSFTEIAMHSTEPAKGDPSVKARAEQMADRVTYLMERLILVEVDEASQRAQLRSAPPQQVDGAVEYYEAFLSRETDETLWVHLVRYHQAEGAQRRSRVPINLTREVLRRLLDDLAEIVRPDTIQASASAT